MFLTTTAKLAGLSCEVYSQNIEWQFIWVHGQVAINPILPCITYYVYVYKSVRYTHFTTQPRSCAHGIRLVTRVVVNMADCLLYNCWTNKIEIWEEGDEAFRPSSLHSSSNNPCTNRLQILFGTWCGPYVHMHANKINWNGIFLYFFSFSQTHRLALHQCS